MNIPPKKSSLQTEDKYIVRFPDGMRERIAEEAKKNGRSMNAEIIARIEKSFASNSDEYATKDELIDVMQQIRDLFARTEQEYLQKNKPQ